VVHYTVHIETDASEPVAHALLQKYVFDGRRTPTEFPLWGDSATAFDYQPQRAYWVQFQISIPANFGVEVSTGAVTLNVRSGRARPARNAGRHIRTGPSGIRALTKPFPRSRYAAKLETQGGHITVLDVAGDLDAFTAGGHIKPVISQQRQAAIRGGHIRARSKLGAKRTGDGRR